MGAYPLLRARSNCDCELSVGEHMYCYHAHDITQYAQWYAANVVTVIGVVIYWGLTLLNCGCIDVIVHSFPIVGVHARRHT